MCLGRGLRETTFWVATLIVILLGGFLFVACSRQQRSEGRSLEQRVAEMEMHGMTNRRSPGESELRDQYERHLVEIRGLGLVDRAQRDFSSRYSNAVVERWSIGYFVNTNTVWCDFRYRFPGSDESLQHEFGYTRKTGTNWSLIWGGGEPQH
jgi:hypothetical protein